jgi:hypothetical protein
VPTNRNCKGNGTKASIGIGLFMSRMLHDFPLCSQRLSLTPGSSMQHERDMERGGKRPPQKDAREKLTNARTPLPAALDEELDACFR